MVQREFHRCQDLESLWAGLVVKTMQQERFSSAEVAAVENTRVDFGSDQIYRNHIS
jgi:hypothetical protein